ncbi:GNAT family N-acetyltransferase [Actinotalea subterranea]|uniref:GNAT family N-acetyltransferase n=1 Tax=Actinotalea subterranea TaxID=2607497 RepID=UPI0011EE89EB|nr:GNAT family N-acetyltransferase [Actinotalea subterranea]
MTALGTDLTALLHNWDTYWLGWGVRDRGSVDGLAYHVSGVPHPILNGVTSSAAPASEVLPELRERLRGLPWVWQVSPLSRPGTVDELLAGGGVDAGSLDVMALDPAAFRPVAEPPAGLSVNEVPAEADLGPWVDGYRDAFGVPPEARDLTVGVERQRSYDAGARTRLVGVLAGSVVATTEVLVTGTVAGIYVVATQAEHRGRGIATALVSAGVERALRDGATAVTLQAEPGALGVYRRVGFRSVSHLTSVYFAPAPAPAPKSSAAERAPRTVARST